jgi:DNA polymerase III epsilon subunit-like protein
MDERIKRYVIGDTETCGLGEDKKACQVGLIEIDPVTLEPLWSIESLIDPQWPIGEYATSMHGITNEMVADEPTMDEFVKHRLPGGRLTGEVTLICHNIKFDEDLLTPIGTVTRGICTLNESRHWIKGPANYKLATLAEYYGIVANDAHQALADCFTTLEVLKQIVKVSGRTLDQLADVKVREVLVQPWGMHAGKLMIDVPESYLQWMLRDCEDLEPNLKRAVQKALELK